MTPDITSVYPKGVRARIARTVRYSTYDKAPRVFMSTMLWLSICAAILMFLLCNNQFGQEIAILFALAAFALVQVSFYSWLILSADSKANFVDSILPDALRLISSNLRSGLTIDRALINSAREEFGPLKDAIDIAGKKIATGYDEKVAFMSMLERINSQNLERAIDLIVQGIRSGGQLAGILDKIADIFNDRSMLSKEMRSTVLMYAIFIFFVLGLGAPVLFGISDYLVRTTTTGIGAQIPEINGDAVIVGAPLPIMSRSAQSVSPDFMTMYFVLAMIISAITGSVILGQVMNGKEKAGLKFIPILITLSIVLFFAIKYLLSITLGSMLGGG